MLHGRHDRKSNAAAASATLSDSYAIGINSANIWRNRPRFTRVGRALQPTGLTSIVRFDLVEERIAQAVGVGVPLPRPLVGSQRRRPHQIGTVAAVHRQVEAVAE